MVAKTVEPIISENQFIELLTAVKTTSPAVDGWK